MERRGKTKRFTLRLLIFFAGLVVLSLGIDLNTKTQLGISADQLRAVQRSSADGTSAPCSSRDAS